MLTHAPSRDWLAAHRRVWEHKPSLRAVYTRWFDRLHRACEPGAPIIELGCGPGFLKDRYPDIVATDAWLNIHADGVLDAGTLPFGDEQIAHVVMLDVFHHLPAPVQFLREAARTLRAGGRVAMIEPWLGTAGQLLFRYVHHEECDPTVDPAAPWALPSKDPMRGNVALPYLYFRPGGLLESLGLPLRVIQREPFTALPWMLSGGFQRFTLLPAAAEGAVERLDRVLSLLPRLTATRCFVLIEKSRGAPQEWSPSRHMNSCGDSEQAPAVRRAPPRG
jgi:SAM-dependent methyltransferase